MQSLKASQLTGLYPTLLLSIKKTGSRVTYVIADLLVLGLATFFRTKIKVLEIGSTVMNPSVLRCVEHSPREASDRVLVNVFVYFLKFLTVQGFINLSDWYSEWCRSHGKCDVFHGLSLQAHLVSFWEGGAVGSGFRNVGLCCHNLQHIVGSVGARCCFCLVTLVGQSNGPAAVVWRSGRKAARLFGWLFCHGRLLFFSSTSIKISFC